MNDLIKVETNETGEQLISARDLHEFLESKEHFNRWFNRMIEYGFEENIEYCKNVTLENTGFEGNGTQKIDYIIKLDMAKEISMLARNEKGKKARKYFIEIEKAWNTPELIMARALQVANKTISQHKESIKKLENKIEGNKPKVEFAEKLLSSKDNILVREYAKILFDEGIRFGEKKLYKWFKENKYLMQNKEPYQTYMRYFYVKERTINTPFGTKLGKTTMINPEGQIYFYHKLKNQK